MVPALYDELRQRLDALCAGEFDPIALMATVACEVHHALPQADWTGFYRVVAPGLLKIGPYQGGHGCLTIPFDRGVCGAAARTGQAQRVDDVHQFPGHIACAASTQSELVLPVWNRRGDLLGVFDIDSNQPAAFSEADELALTTLLACCFANCAGPA
ncbi:MAG: GAF domain-containing protein [Gammaproteobacteria bacterium]|jgi:GAF domain-containing protein|nr:GAF domain-containing protein [Gammaproteobacteria bacterium]